MAHSEIQKYSLQHMESKVGQLEFVSNTIVFTKNYGKLHVRAKVKVKSQSCPTFSNPMDCSPPGSSVREIFWARVLESVAISFSRGSSWPRDQALLLCLSLLTGEFFTTSATWEAQQRALRKTEIFKKIFKTY